MDPLPDTVLTALVGRTVDALAVVHPDFDRRVIRRAENMRGEKRPTVRIGVDQHLVPMPA